MADPYAGMDLTTFVQPPPGASQQNMFAGAGQAGMATMNPLIAAGGIGLEFAGNMMAQNAGVSRRTVRRRGKEALARAQSQDALFGGLQRAALMKGQKAELAGFQGARGALDLGGTVARQRAMAMGRQQQAAMEQSVLSRGLQGTSTGLQQFAGVGDRTTAALNQIDLQLAQAFADLGLQESSLQGEHGRELAALAGQDRAFQKGVGEGYFGLQTMG